MGKYLRMASLMTAVLLVGTMAGCQADTPMEVTAKDVLQEPEAVRIMSFNIRCGEYATRKSLVPRLILEYAPDSVGVQECTYQWYKRLTDTLTGYGFVGVGRDTGGVQFDCGEISGIFYRLDKYKVVDSGTFWLSETPEKVSYGWDAGCRRVCTWAVLEHLETGAQYAHVNTHLDHKGLTARTESTKLVGNHVLTFEMPTVLTGDFNYERDTAQYQHLLELGLRDTQTLAENTMEGKTFHAYNGGEQGLPIDFIFVNERVERVLTYRIIRDRYEEQYPSHHYPIYADAIFGQ